MLKKNKTRAARERGGEEGKRERRARKKGEDESPSPWTRTKVDEEERGRATWRDPGWQTTTTETFFL